MNKIIAFIMMLALLTSCGAARKVQRNVENSRLYGVNVDKETTEKTDRFIDTTRTSNERITITEIEFFEPAVISSGTETGNGVSGISKRLESACNDTGRRNKYADAFKRADSAFWSKYGNNGVGGGAGIGINLSGIKSIKQKVIETNVEARGISGESADCSDTENTSIVDASETNVDEQQEPTKDPYRWRYIFYIVLIVAIVVVGVWLCNKRIPIFKWIKSIF